MLLEVFRGSGSEGEKVVEVSAFPWGVYVTPTPAAAPGPDSAPRRCTAGEGQERPLSLSPELDSELLFFFFFSNFIFWMQHMGS